MSDKKDDDNIIKIPTLKERDRIAREKREADKRAKKKNSPWSVSYKGTAWKSGDGSSVGSSSGGNSGFKKREPFFNTGNIPVFTKSMVIAFITIHVITHLALSKSTLWDIQQSLAFIPGMFTGTISMPSLLSLLSPLTHTLLHAGWMHIVFNSIMMLIFGMFVENRLGPKPAAFFFFAGGAIGALGFLALHPSGDTQLIGASGGISALFGVVLIMMHTENRFGALPIGRNKGPWPIVAIWCVIMAVTGMIGGGNIAWQAHIAGFLSGAILYWQVLKGRLRL